MAEGCVRREKGRERDTRERGGGREREAGGVGGECDTDDGLKTLTVGGPVPSPSRKPQLPSSNHTSRYPSKASSHPDPVPKVMRYPAFS